MKRADTIQDTDSAINYAVFTVSLIHFYYIQFLDRGQLGFSLSHLPLQLRGHKLRSLSRQHLLLQVRHCRMTKPLANQ